MAENTTAGYYTPPTPFVGKTVNQLRYGGEGIDPSTQFGGRIDQLAAALGIGEQTPLENKGYTIVAGPGQESDYIQRTFKQTDPYQGAYDALGESKKITEQAYTERGRQLEGEKQPLMDRYQSIIDELKGKETKETGQVATGLSREYGKRGIPLSSGAYEQDLGGKTRDISQFYAGQTKEVGFEREDKLRELGNLQANLPIEKAKDLNAIDQRIAEMKASGADKSMQMALQMYRDEREEKWRQQEFDLKKQEFELSKEDSTALKDQYATIGEGSTLYDLLNRQALFTAPKTYKPEDGSTLQDLESLFG